MKPDTPQPTSTNKGDVLNITNPAFHVIVAEGEAGIRKPLLSEGSAEEEITVFDPAVHNGGAVSGENMYEPSRWLLN